MNWKDELRKILDRPEIEPPEEKTRERQAMQEQTTTADMDLSFLEVEVGDGGDDCKCDVCEKKAEYKCAYCNSILCAQHLGTQKQKKKFHVHNYQKWDCKPGWRDKQ
tara:strand:- start:400 stop:720 length:321 start_codon:yes stop_codon:yes gene_type:complete